MSKDDIIQELSTRNKLLDFMDKYNVDGLMYADKEQLSEYLFALEAENGEITAVKGRPNK